MIEPTMKRAIALTNFALLYLVLLVLLMLGLGIAFYPFDSAAELLIFFGLFLGINVFGAVLASIVQAKLIGKDSVWLQPASERAGTILTNSVVFVWLCGIGLILFAVLQGKGSTNAMAGVILVLLAGAGLGRYLQKRFWSKSWLGYGISFTAALVVILVISAMLKS